MLVELERELIAVESIRRGAFGDESSKRSNFTFRESTGDKTN
jgi:hypothetical protein